MQMLTNLRKLETKLQLAFGPRNVTTIKDQLKLEALNRMSRKQRIKRANKMLREVNWE